MQSAETSSKIYLINCLSAMEEPLVFHPAASGYVNHLRSMIEMHMNLLVEKEANGILSRCGLSDKICIIKEQPEGGKALSDIPETSPHTLSESLRAFFGLVTGNKGSLPEFEQLQIPRLRSDAASGVARTLAGAYEIVYAAVMDPNNGYDDARSLAKHSPQDVRTMLAI
jgi:conserved oligomeric Golgi complex subunit 6